MTPSAPRPPTPKRTSQKLAPVERRTFKVDGQSCCITCFDVLPNGMFVIADSRRGGWLYIFSNENRKLCDLYAASSETSVLDLAVLTKNRFAYIDKINTHVIHFVQIGERYRHMERQGERHVDFYCRRIYCFENQIFLACTQSVSSGSSILILNIYGDQISEVQCPDFCINSLAYHRNKNTGNTYLYATDIEKGIKSYEKRGDAFTSVRSAFRDIDAQWYYGIASDRHGNVFVCVQDEFGPEIYKLELFENNPLIVIDMRLHLTKADGLDFPTMIRYNHHMDNFIVGAFEVSFEQPVFPDVAVPDPDKFQSMRGRHDREGTDRQYHAQMNNPCRCTTLGIYKLEEYNERDPVRAIVTPSEVEFANRRRPVRLIPEGKMSFSVDGVDCLVSCYDVLPKGETDIIPSGKIVIADARQKQICIFGPATAPRNILHCKMRVNTSVLDVAALSHQRLVFVTDNRNAVYFVVAGKRFRHMEIEKMERTNWNGRRVRYFENKLFIVSMNNTKDKSCIEIFDLNEHLDYQPLRTIDCGEFHFITSIAVNASHILISSVADGIRVYDHTGRFISLYRDIDVQWYYGIARDKYDNWFICTQDELGPEIYEIQVDNNGAVVTGLFLRITEKEGLEPPFTLCYHPRLDRLMVGSNHIDAHNSELRRFRRNVASRDPYLVEKEAREMFALEAFSWRTADCDLYKIVYQEPTARPTRHIHNLL